MDNTTRRIERFCSTRDAIIEAYLAGKITRQQFEDMLLATTDFYVQRISIEKES